MSDITKHDAKEEWKGNCREIGWVDLLVGRGPVCIDDVLKDLSKGISLDESRRRNTLTRDLLYLYIFSSILLHFMHLVEKLLPRQI